ncbi:MAG: hypothetical protein C4547_04340 [Phycisphaerales bacterium]|nr:MAG: hypothetical protein C4547_04340 [Phycisphaerales bacterium]
MSEVLELFGHSTDRMGARYWTRIVADQHCPYLNRRCIKVRKSEPDVSIGTCTVNHGQERRAIMICPFRFLERRQIFVDALHLLTLHEPGNELHVVPEVTIPGGSVDYFLVSARNGKPLDFVGIELQTLDTTGTVWPARQRFLQSVKAKAPLSASAADRPFGMNWKMTAKTSLLQLHHEVETFEHLSKRLVLVLQDCLLEYMQGEFTLGHLSDPKVGHAMHVHAYKLDMTSEGLRLGLVKRLSTDAAGVATVLGLQAQARVELESILAAIEERLSAQTLWSPV